MRHATPSRAAITLALAIAAASVSFARANTELDVPNATIDLTTLGATSTSDLTFTNLTYAPAAFTLTAATVTIGTLDDLDTTQTLTLANAGPNTPSTLALSGGPNAVAPNPTDLLYVAAGGTLTINGGASTTTPTVTNTLLALTLGAPGTLDILGTANVGAATSWGANPITKIGSGALALTSPIANTSTGPFTIAEGTLSIGGGGNAGNTALGAAGTPVTFGGGTANTLLAFTTPESGISQNFTIAAGGGARAFTSSGGSITQGNAAVFAAADTITLNDNLTLANLVASAPNANVFGFRGVISQSGGAFGLTVDKTNVGTVDLRGANTFSGGLSLNGGTTTFNISSTPNAVGTTTITSGPLGTGSVTLGGDPTTAATLGAGSPRTLLAVATAASTTAAAINSPLTLNADLTLSANLVVSSTGNDRLRVGGGGITGSNNILINNPNIFTTFATRAPIVLTGSPTGPTTWTGNLIIAQGQGALGLASTSGSGLNAITAANTVMIASAATFDFSSNVAGIGGFNPTIAGLDDFGAITTPSQVFTSVTTNRILTLAGSGAYAFSGSIENSINTSGATALTVTFSSPTASQTLSGSSTYSGGTILNAGKLLLTNTAGSALGSGNVTLNGGTLGGIGSLAGSILPGSGPHTIQPGLATTPGTLSIGGDLSTNANTTLAFNLASPAGSNPLLTVTGNLTLNGGAITVPTQSITGATSLGYYKVISYAGVLTSTTPLTLPTPANNIAYTLDTIHDPNFIDIHRGYIGDANDDGKVDLSDLNIVLNNLGTPSTSWGTGNFDGAATIDLTDLNDVLNNLGTSIASTSSVVAPAPAPEPATLTLAACGAAALFVRRKR